MTAHADTDAVVANPLRAAGVVDQSALDRARALQAEWGGSLVDALLRLNLVKESDYLRIFAELYATRFVKAEKLRGLGLDQRLLGQVGPEVAERLRMCPIRWTVATQQVHVVAVPPLASGLDAEVRALTGAHSVAWYIGTPGAVAALIRVGYYGDTDAFSQVTPNGAGPFFPQERKPEPELDDEAPSHQDATVIAAVPTEPEDRPRTATQKGFDPTEKVTIATLRKENARYRMAQEFHRRVGLERDPGAMVDRILSAMFDLLPAEGAAIWLQNGQYASKARDGLKKVEVPRAIIDQAIQSQGGLLVNNALVDERFDKSASVMIRGVQSVMAVPLRTPRSGTLGILYVESTSMSAAFGDDDVPLLESIGAQAAILLDNAALLAQVRQEVENRVSLSRFLSAAAVEEVLSGRMNLRMEGTSAEITVLFADIRGFTTMSSQMPPEEVVRFLNLFFTEMVESVERHGGIVDKFIGDCVMALWGAVEKKPGNPRQAIAAALEMIERSRHITVDGRPLQVGVGITTGPAVVGAIGSRHRLDYTAIGSTVNLSARLCGIAEGGQVLITSDTLLAAGPGVITEAGESVILKGIDVPVVPYLVKSVTAPLLLGTPLAQPPR